MSQKSRLMAALQMGPVCSLEPNDWHPPIRRTAARVNELKHDGHQITTRPCQRHSYRTAAHVVYELATKNQMELMYDVR